jgi:hypothetical protein
MQNASFFIVRELLQKLVRSDCYSRVVAAELQPCIHTNTQALELTSAAIIKDTKKNFV